MRDRRDAAEVGFYKACKTAKACKQAGLDTRYPYHRKRWRTTSWKAPKGMDLQQGILLLKRAHGLSPVEVSLPSHLLSLPAASYLEGRLVWDRAARHCTWHVVIEDDTEPAPPPQGASAAAIESP